MENYHNKSVNTCLKELKSSLKGLTQIEAERRILKYGENKLETEKPLSSLIIFLDQFRSPLIYILLVAGLISAILNEYVDAGVIFASVILNSLVGFFQENKANKALSKLKEMVEHKAIVIRDGLKKEVDSSQVTIGDIIVLNSGNRVSSDSRIIEATDLQVNEASLTGESMPSEKSSDKITTGVAMADRENMVYAGTVVVRGIGKAVVTAIASKTELGSIASLVETTHEDKTPLQLRLGKLSGFIGIAVTVICVLVVLIGISQGRDFFEMFITGVAVAVASIPQSMVVASTVTLVLGMQQILKQKALTRKLVAAETLGSTTVICTDKTGTLTEGVMSVTHIVVGEKEFEFDTFGSRQDKEEARIVSLALQIGMMCNEAIIDNPDQLDEIKIIGGPTESALLKAAIQSGLNQEKLLKIEPRIASLPFSSENKFMITLHKNAKEEFVIYEKGAPERILKKASKYYHHGKACVLNKAQKQILENNYEYLTGKGLRVIAVAIKEIGKRSKIDYELVGSEYESGSISWEKIDNNLTFVGFIALKDPLRKEAKETIEICRRAGIRPVIITGDHKLTAKAVAIEIGLRAKNENIITGEELEKIDDKKIEEVVKKIDIYARVSPHHKLRIIRALQANGEVVAMTGDGINDSPALKAADIGISLGTGTDIAKETSDLILLDDNFKTIVSAVKQGRIIFANIQKVITYLVSDSFSEVILIVGSIVFGMPLAVLPAQILWINIVNDGLPGFALAFEKEEDDVMEDEPIKKNAHIINKEMKIIIFAAGIIRDLFIFSIFYYLYMHDFALDYIRTLIFAAIGIDSLIYVYSLRSLKKPIWRMNPFGNLYLVGATLISAALLLVAIYFPPLQSIMSTVPLDLNSWMILLSIGFLSIIMIEIVKHSFIKKDR